MTVLSVLEASAPEKKGEGCLISVLPHDPVKTRSGEAQAKITTAQHTAIVNQSRPKHTCPRR
ncbi:MAG TPA: hypothetical protein VLA60_14800 [Nitrospirales bacterium]|nr:hypothetical protein [Nitrospirales bacterium]